MQNFGVIIYLILFSIITFGKIFLFVAEAKPLYRKPFLEEDLLCHADTSLIHQDYFMQTMKYPSTQKKFTFNL